MAEKVSLAKLNVLQKKLETAQKRIAKVREVADDKVQHIVSATEVATAAFALSTAKGYFGSAADVGGVPLELTAALLLHGAGLFGIGGDMSSHLHSFGNGALAAAAAGFGKEIGMHWKTGGSLGDAVKKAMPLGDSTRTITSGQRLSDDELARLAAGV